MRKTQAALKIVTRTKTLDECANLKPRVVALNMKLLQAHFSSPLSTAADCLGVSLTALKWYLFYVHLYVHTMLKLESVSPVHVEKWGLRNGHIAR